MRVALAALAACLDRLGRYDPAAAITGFAVSPYTATIDQARMELNAVSTTYATRADVLLGHVISQVGLSQKFV